MLYRWVAVCGVVLSTAVVAVAAQDFVIAPYGYEHPTQLPPLLRPPVDDPSAPGPAGPVGPTGEYDHGHLYLPEYAPPSGPEACRPLGRWWVSPTLELAWIPVTPAPAAVRLRILTGFDRSIPGPNLPVAGRSSRDFQTGFGLSLGRWFDEQNTRAVDASLYFLAGGDQTLTGDAPGMLVLFPDGTRGGSPQVLVFPPGTPIVGIFPATLSTWFISADVNYRQNVYCTANARLDALAGYRYAFLQDELYLGEPPDGTTRDDHRRNRIAASNPFHGGQIGIAGEYRANQWFVGGVAKIAFGVVIPEVRATRCVAGVYDPGPVCSRGL
jgi:hypothetical protein